jgi:uncharacterized protein YceH (UPF0502 family)
MLLQRNDISVSIYPRRYRRYTEIAFMTIARNLTLSQTRVIGALLEKELTTPDQYPLSLNALTTACNQKTNREPVMELAESEVRTTVDELLKQRLVMEESGFGSRVSKIRHRFCNTEFGALKLSPQEVGIVCVMLLRGAQTPGELRTRTNRLCEFSDVHEVERCLDAMAARNEPLVTKLPREPGQREARYAHLFGEHVDEAPQMPRSSPAVSNERASASDDRMAMLEARIDTLQQEIELLKKRLDDVGA